MNSPTPRFTGIFIPSEILDHPDLTMLEQLLLSWIDALYCKAHRGCYAKNEYFAQKLKVKENTVAKALTSLRQKNLIEDVSFDGRNRIIRSKIGQYIEECQSNAGLDLNPRQGLTEIQGSIGQKSNDTYIESKEENTPIYPHQKSAAKAAKGARKKGKHEVSEQAKELFPKFIKVIQDFKPTYVVKKKENILASLDEMLKDGRDEQEILRVLGWCVKDNSIRGNWSGWSSKVICQNPASYLCTKFEQIDTASKATQEDKAAQNPVIANRKLAEKIKAFYKDHTQLSVSNGCIEFTPNYTEKHLYYQKYEFKDWDHSTFKKNVIDTMIKFKIKILKEWVDN